MFRFEISSLNSDLNKVYRNNQRMMLGENTHWYEFIVFKIKRQWEREKERERDKRERFLTSFRQFISRSAGAYLVRWMMWIPLSVCTGEDSSPTFSVNAACSKGFCIAPRLKGPRSPPRFAELQSLYLEASSANVALPEAICSL